MAHKEKQQNENLRPHMEPGGLLLRAGFPFSSSLATQEVIPAKSICLTEVSITDESPDPLGEASPACFIPSGGDT